ncbi:hypothetical protein [Bradyrhizobium sp. NBAIM03]|nr:hypothetical protein [Bradyrhizobium sp. NBAIM03]
MSNKEVSGQNSVDDNPLIKVSRAICCFACTPSRWIKNKTAAS